jgi:hypothetical protein
MENSSRAHYIHFEIFCIQYNYVKALCMQRHAKACTQDKVVFRF